MSFSRLKSTKKKFDYNMHLNELSLSSGVRPLHIGKHVKNDLPVLLRPADFTGPV